MSLNTACLPPMIHYNLCTNITEAFVINSPCLVSSFSQPFPDIVPAKKSPWSSTPISLVSHITWARLQLCATFTPGNTQGQLHSTAGAGVGMWTTHTAALCTCSTFWTWSFFYVFVYISLLSTSNRSSINTWMNRLVLKFQHNHSTQTLKIYNCKEQELCIKLAILAIKNFHLLF